MKLTIIYIINIIFTVLNLALGLNILGIFPYEGISHFLVYKVLMHELARKGHNVTVISHFPQKDVNKNYHDITLKGTRKIGESITLPSQNTYAVLLFVGQFFLRSGPENCNVLLANKKVHELIKQETKFDVVIVPQFDSDCALGVAYKLGAPVVGVTSHILLSYHYNRFGVPSNVAYVPFPFLGGGTMPTFWQRIEAVVYEFYIKGVYYWTQQVDQYTLSKYFDDIPPLEELARDIKVLLLYRNFVLSGSQLYPSNVIDVGGYHVQKAMPLSGDLKKFVEKADHGVVYVSFGSVLNPSSISNDQIKAIIETMMELPQRFIWKWKNRTILLDREKLYTADWLPQADILAHPNTLAFLSHTGMGGTTEALHFGVPIIAVPFFGDQLNQAAAIEETGFGVRLSCSDLNKKNLLAAFKKVLDPEFRTNAKRISAVWHDRPLPPLDTAVFWVEFTARNANFTFRSKAADVPFYQYLYLDIGSVFLLVFIALISPLYWYCKRKVHKAPRNKGKKGKHD